MLPMVIAQSSSDDSTIRYVLPVFEHDVMFSHNGANWPESNTVGMFALFC